MAKLKADAHKARRAYKRALLLRLDVDEGTKEVRSLHSRDRELLDSLDAGWLTESLEQAEEAYGHASGMHFPGLAHLMTR